MTPIELHRIDAARNRLRDGKGLPVLSRAATMSVGGQFSDYRNEACYGIIVERIPHNSTARIHAFDNHTDK